jgi:hypothetical protein
MPYRATIQNLVESAFVTLGDITETISYKHKTSSSYNVGTGAVANAVTNYSVPAVIKFLGGEVDGNTKEKEFTGDLQVMFASKDLNSGSTEPNTADTIQYDSEIYSINSIKSDSVKASYTLNLVRLG